MVTAQTHRLYKAAIGIECHVQLKTKTKLFSAVGNDARQAPPNTLISHIDLGLPGALPVLNAKAVEYAVRMAYVFNTEPQTYSYFERKHYFYPDLPKGYQITQLAYPIIVGGYVQLESGKRVHLNRVQIEEDAGKNIHPAGADYSLVDLNRAGTPLLEIVSEPDIETSEQAKAYARELYLLVRYADVSDADLFHGNMRFDVNVSVSKNFARLGTRTETKNLNSFRSVEKTVEYEISRQIEALEKGHKIVQETRGWDDAKQRTFSQRGKEEAHDYRYMPEPDIPPLKLDKSFSAAIQKSIPVLPHEWRQRLASLGLSKSHSETLLEAQIAEESIDYLPIIEETLKDKKYAATLANWFVNIEIPLRASGQAHSQHSNGSRHDLYKAVYGLLTTDKLSSTGAKALITELLSSGVNPDDIAQFASDEGYIQVSDKREIEKIVAEVIEANPQAAKDVKKGEMKAIGFLVGQAMKLSQGKANPALVQKLIKAHPDIKFRP